MPTPPDPWELEMMRQYKIEDVAELRKLLAQPPSPKYARSDELEANQLELERCLENYELEHRMDFLWRVPIAVMLIAYFLFLGAVPLMSLVGMILSIAGIIHEDGGAILGGLAMLAMPICFCKAWWQGCNGFWKMSRSPDTWRITRSYKLYVLKAPLYIAIVLILWPVVLSFEWLVGGPKVTVRELASSVITVVLLFLVGVFSSSYAEKLEKENS